MYHGAPILASLAALRCGTDLVYTAVPKINSQATRAASPNLIVIPLADQKLTRGAAKKLLGQTPVGLDSAAIGMGLAVQERNSLLMLIKTLLDSDVRLLLDASALVPEVLPEISGKNCILSPHTGEYKRLFGHAVPDDDASREREVEKMAAEHKVVIILKGATDIISDGETTYTNPKKNSIYDSWGNRGCTLWSCSRHACQKPQCITGCISCCICKRASRRCSTRKIWAAHTSY